MVSSGQFAELLAPGLDEILFHWLRDQPMQWTGVLNIKSSTRAYEDDFKVGGLGPMQSKPEGTNTIFDDPVKGNTVRYTHDSFGLGCRITREMWDDDLYDIISAMPRELGRSVNYKVEVDAWSVINNADTAGFVGEDGLTLLNTAHTRLDGGTAIANRPSTVVQFSFSALQAGMDHFNGLVDDRGRPLVVTPRLIVVSPTFKWAAKEIIGSEYKPYTGDNTINPLADEGLQFMVSRYLTVSTRWMLLAQKADTKLKWYWRTKPETASADDFLSGDMLYKSFARYSRGFTEWRGVYGSQGS